MTRPDRRTRPTRHIIVALAAVGLVAASCADESVPSMGESDETPHVPSPDSVGAGSEVSIHSELKPVSGNLEGALTYNPELAPVGARMQVDSMSRNGSTTVELEVEGFLPNRGYGVHAHTEQCGPTGDAAGPHYQHVVDPMATPDNPSHDPEYANPRNEIWLDLVTDGEGNGKTTAKVPFDFTDRVNNVLRAPDSVVVHEQETTATGPGEAGKAGGRIACMTVPFGH
jgi:Cu-Zn family superoxide dismutase